MSEEAAARYEITMDPENYTTRRALTVGRSRMVHALSEEDDRWGIAVGRLTEGQTFATALCGQRSPVMNRNHGHKPSAQPVTVDCSKCRKVMDRIAANRIKAEGK